MSFGDCPDWGGEIGFARLLAYPTAQRCTPCQDRHEKTFPRFDPELIVSGSVILWRP